MIAQKIKTIKIYGYVMRGNVTADPANFSMAAVQQIFGEQLLTCGL
jgi:hypothetical protein